MCEANTYLRPNGEMGEGRKGELNSCLAEKRSKEGYVLFAHKTEGTVANDRVVRAGLESQPHPFWVCEFCRAFQSPPVPFPSQCYGED